jgi:hypothetical protein
MPTDRETQIVLFHNFQSLRHLRHKAQHRVEKKLIGSATGKITQKHLEVFHMKSKQRLIKYMVI